MTIRVPRSLRQRVRLSCFAEDRKTEDFVADAHRLCRIMFAMLRDHAEFDVSKLAIEVGPFTFTAVRHYRLRPVHTVRLGTR